MAQTILEFVLSAVAVTIAGAVLARAADRLADLTGFGRLIIGGVLLAGATSLPELSIDINAVRRGLDDVALGDLMGSSLANLLILAVADLFHHSRGRMLSRASAAHALSGAMTMLLTALASLAILASFDASLLGVGAGSLIVFIAYVLGTRLIYQDRMRASAAAPNDGDARDVQPKAASRRADLRNQWLRFALAAGAILVAAPFVARSAGQIAEFTGLGDTFIGTTLVALATSLPEMVAVITTVRMGAFDLAVGNIFGSNAFNMAVLLPVDLASSGPLLSSVSRTHAVTGLWVIVITAVAVVGQLYHAERRRRLIEPDALLIIGLVLAALATVYRLR